MALAAVEHLPKPLSLEYALKLTELFARTGDQRFDAAAVRWLGRLIEERKLTLAAIRLAVEAVGALPDEGASQVLHDLARRR
jgi:hypothetical protein